jgi:membrane protease subunit HflC
VHQTQQVLITQFGQPIRVIREPGLQVKIPFIQSVIALRPPPAGLRRAGRGGHPRRPAPADRGQLHALPHHRPAAVLPDRRRDGSRHPARLNSIVTSALRRVLGNEPLLSVLSTDRARIMGEIRRQVNEEARRFGIEVTDVRIRRADLPEENTQAILNRMQSERERVAREARAEGAEVAARVRAGADRERTVLLAEAQASADILRGQGEQEAIGIFASAFQRDPAFFQFWRSMQAYREAFSEGDTRMLISPDSEFFRFFRESMPLVGAGAAPGNGAPPAARPGPAAAPAAAPPAPVVAPASAAAAN